MISEDDFIKETNRMLHIHPKIKKYIWISLLLLIGLTLSFLIADNVSATTYDWDGGDADDSLASSADNWNPNGVPVTGDVIEITGTWDDAITWDLGAGVVIASYDQQAGYSGTLTTTSIFNCSGAFNLHGGTFVQGAFDVFTGSVTMDGGTLTGNVNAWWTCSGDWIKTSGTHTGDVAKWILSGIGTYSTNAATYFKYLQLTGTYTATSSLVMSTSATGCDISGSLTVASTKSLSDFKPQYTTITGTLAGNYVIWNYNGVLPSLIGDLSGCNLRVSQDGGTSSKTVSISNALLFLTVQVDHSGTSGTTTFNLNGHSLSATTVTASTRGIISSSVAGAKLTATGTITAAANGQINATNIAYLNCKSFDPSAGTWVPGVHQVNMTANYGILKLSVSQSIYDLHVLDYNFNVTGQTNITHNLFTSGLTPNSYYNFVYGATVIDEYTSDISGNINIGIIILTVQNLYHFNFIGEALIFTSSPPLIGYVDIDYYYLPICNNNVTFSVILSDNQLQSKTDGSIGGTVDNYTDISINITAEDIYGHITYQNFTVVVEMYTPIPMDITPIIYLVFMIFLTILNIIGYVKIPILSLISLVSIILLVVAVFTALSGYEIIAFIFILSNALIAFFGILNVRKAQYQE